jgi:Leucine-rich repeat (LRR) protein
MIDNIEEAAIFENLVQPVLNDKCISCHNEDKKRGGLDLTSAELLLEGGDTGEVFMPGASGESELIRRLWLPLSHDDHMPPEGKPQMTIAEAELIRWWIDQGGSFELTLAEAEITPQVQQVLDGLGLEERKTGIFALEVAAPDSSAMMALGAQGISVMGLAEDVPFVQVHCTNALDSVGDEQMSLLEPLAEQITWLNLGRTGVTDAGLQVVANMPHLTRLHLENTQITDAALGHLKDLQYLEYLNLYGTQVTDEGIQQLAGLPRLRSLYLWQTRVTNVGAEQLKQALPKLEINMGWEQTPVKTAADEEEGEGAP